MHSSLKFLKKFGDLSPESLRQLEELAIYRKFPVKKLIASAGETPQHLYLLISGVLRAYLTSESGKEFNKRIYTSMSFAGALTSIIKNEPSEINYQCLTECKMFEFNFNHFRILCRENFEIGRLYVRVLEHVFVVYEERNLELMTLNGTERYVKLLKQIPNIEELIPQYQIASYLNISAVQLSRIRKKFRVTEY